VAIDTIRQIAKSSPSVCFECGDTTLHDSAQESQSRGSDDSASSGRASASSGQLSPSEYLSRWSQGQQLWEESLGYSGLSPGCLSGVSCDVSCPAIPALQQSTRMPARQSAGPPTKLQKTMTSAKIRMASNLRNAPARVNESRPGRCIRVVTNQPRTKNVARFRTACPHPAAGPAGHEPQPKVHL